jgi:hypothetical protein
MCGRLSMPGLLEFADGKFAASNSLVLADIFYNSHIKNYSHVANKDFIPDSSTVSISN